MAIGFVCSQRSIRYPKKPPTTMADTITIGNSKAVANWEDAESEVGPLSRRRRGRRGWILSGH